MVHWETLECDYVSKIIIIGQSIMIPDIVYTYMICIQDQLVNWSLLKDSYMDILPHNN